MPKGGSADPGAGFSGSGGRAAAGEIGRAAADRAGGGQGTTPAANTPLGPSLPQTTSRRRLLVRR